MNYRETEASLQTLEEQLVKLNEQETKLNEEYNNLFENLKLSKNAQRKCEDELDEIRFKGLTVSDEQKERVNQLLEIQDKLINDQRSKEAEFKMFQEKFEQLKEEKKILQGNLEYRKVNAFALEEEIKNLYNNKVSKQQQIENLKNSPYSNNAAIASMLMDLNEELKAIETKYENLKRTYKNVVGKEYGKNIDVEDKKENPDKDLEDLEDIENKADEMDPLIKDEAHKDLEDVENKAEGMEPLIKEEKDKDLEEQSRRNGTTRKRTSNKRNK